MLLLPTAARATPVPPLQAGARVAAKVEARTSDLADRLTALRKQVLTVERDLIDSVRDQKHAQTNVKRIELILKLQRQERELGRKRMQELEKTVSELESRKGTLGDRIREQRTSMRRFLMSIERSMDTDGLRLPEVEKTEAPRRRVMANLVDHGLKEIEAYQVDLADAEKLESRIQEEKDQLAYLFQDLREQEGILEFNRQLQSDMLKRRHEERIAQLENYRRLKSAESKVETLVGEFNARVELDKATQAERAVSRAMLQGAFGRLKGRLPLPLASGRVLSAFGRAFDPKSKLYIFKKGVDISGGKATSVRAISAGRVAYSGELPNYGRVVIIDHGDHFYSLCAHLGELARKAGEAVASGDAIGTTDDLGTPVYFEIRARNVAVNPLQWVSN